MNVTFFGSFVERRKIYERGVETRKTARELGIILWKAVP